MRTEEFEITLGRKLERLRRAKGKSQAEVARDLGLNRKETIQQWESAERHIKASDLVKLSRYYEVSADYLLGLSKAPCLNEETNKIQRKTSLTEEAIKALSDPRNDGWLGEHISPIITCTAGVVFLHALQDIERAVEYAKLHLKTDHLDKTWFLRNSRDVLRSSRLNLYGSVEELIDSLFGVNTILYYLEKAAREIEDKTEADDNREDGQ